MTDGRHAVAEDVSLELHRAVAKRLLEDPAVVDRARESVDEWLRDGSVARPYAEAWRDILAGPIEAIASFLVDTGERARQMRRTSPFAGVLDPKTRWSIWRRVREEARRP